MSTKNHKLGKPRGRPRGVPKRMFCARISAKVAEQARKYCKKHNIRLTRFVERAMLMLMTVEGKP